MPRPEYSVQTDRRTARLFVIACEGQTELIYFSHLAEGLRRVRVAPFVGSDSAPEYVIERLHSYQSASPNSEFWLVIDVDRWFRPNRLGKTHKVLDEAAQRGYNVAISNPKFELWLLLHFQEVESMNGDECEARLKNHFSFDKTNYDFETLRPRISDAARRARALDAAPQARPPVNPNSHVHRLIEAMHRECGTSSPFSI